MYKRALLSLGLGLFGASLAVAAPNGPAADKGAHRHRGVVKSLRATNTGMSFRSDDIASQLKAAKAGDEAKSGSASSSASTSSTVSSTVSSTSSTSSTVSSTSSPGSQRAASSSSSTSKSQDTKSAASDDKLARTAILDRVSPISAPAPPKPSVKVVSGGLDTGLSTYKIRPAVYGGSKGGSFDQERKLRNLGQLIAKEKLPLLSGGGNGNPHTAQKAAFEAGAFTVGFGQASSLYDHTSSGRPHDHLSVLYTTGTGRGPGTIEREAALTEQANVGIFAGGSIGTLGELMHSLYKPGVLAFLKGSGGVADAAVQKILPHLGPLPSHVRIVEESDEERLLISSMVELDKLGAKAKAFPSSTVKVGKREVFSEPEKVKRNFTTVAYLVDGQAMTRPEVEKLRRLVVRLNTERIENRSTVNIVHDRGGLSEELATESAKAGVQTFQVSHRSGGVEERAPKLVRVNLAKGEGVGEAAIGRELSQDARVVVVAGGDYKTLNNLVYALHQDTVVAVLETNGLSGKLRREIMPVISDKDTKARVIYDSDPSALFTKIKYALERPSYGSSSSSSSYSSSQSFDNSRWE